MSDMGPIFFYIFGMTVLVPLIKMVVTIFEAFKDVKRQVEAYDRQQLQQVQYAPKPKPVPDRSRPPAPLPLERRSRPRSVLNGCSRMTPEQQKEYNELRDVRDRIMSFGIEGLKYRDKKILKKYNIIR